MLQARVRATPLPCCNLSPLCLSGALCRTRGTRPLIPTLRPEVFVRMREQGEGRLEFQDAVRGLQLEFQGFPRMRSALQLARESRRGITWCASLGFSDQNLF